MLIGRDDDLRRLRDALGPSRVVTLVGPGGVGKTSLAREVAAERPVSRFADLVPLDEAGLPDAVAGGLGLAGYDALVRDLRAEPGLLVVDNCEHVLDAAADLVERVLVDCPETTLLATSRERLALDDEAVLPVEPLATDGRGAPAVELYRAVASRHGTDLEAEATGLGDLVRRLDGLPLAIELAAARSAAFTPSEMVGHLDARLDLLARSRRRGPERQQSLEAAIAWSFHLLDADERALLGPPGGVRRTVHPCHGGCGWQPGVIGRRRAGVVGHARAPGRPGRPLARRPRTGRWGLVVPIARDHPDLRGPAPGRRRPDRGRGAPHRAPARAHRVVPGRGGHR